MSLTPEELGGAISGARSFIERSCVHGGAERVPASTSVAEFRFLRKQMKYTQKELAKDLGVNEQTVANYEKERKIPPPSDRLIRMSFMVWMAPEEARADLIKRLAQAIKNGEGKPKLVAVDMPPTDIQTSIARQWQGSAVHHRKTPSPVLQEL